MPDTRLGSENIEINKICLCPFGVNSSVTGGWHRTQLFCTMWYIYGKSRISCFRGYGGRTSTYSKVKEKLPKEGQVSLCWRLMGLGVGQWKEDDIETGLSGKTRTSTRMMCEQCSECKAGSGQG